MPDPGTDPLHVVIVGGGFAGMGAARRLARDDRVRVTLIDRNNYHQFQPLLYQVATSQLASSHIAFSLRKMFRKHANVAVKMADVAEVDPATRTAVTTDGDRHTGDVLCSRRARGPTSSTRPARRSSRSRCTRCSTRRGCARGSSPSSRRPTATPR